MSPDHAEQANVPQFGLWDGFGVADSFFDPLPNDIEDAFNGNSSVPQLTEPQA